MLPDCKMKRLQRFVAELAVDLKSLASKVDASYVKTEEFGSYYIISHSAHGASPILTKRPVTRKQYFRSVEREYDRKPRTF